MVIVLCNCPPKDAERIARILVEEKLAACVNMAPVKSVYAWKGELCVDDEVTLLVKTAGERLPELRQRILAMHPYELPEIVVLPVDVERSHAPYVDWVRRGGG
jgi:periplasmic divalent cation tolerance protein